MLICNDCGAIFDEDDVVLQGQAHPYGEGLVGEYHSVCPSCKEGDIVEAVMCTRCGKQDHKDFMEFDNELNYVCGECYDELYV